MGNLATPESLVLRWNEVLGDPSLQDLPYKIELNAWGKVEMSPVFTECSVLTRIGIRVPDVAWAPEEFLNAYGSVRYFGPAGPLAGNAWGISLAPPPPVSGTP